MSPRRSRPSGSHPCSQHGVEEAPTTSSPVTSFFGVEFPVRQDTGPLPQLSPEVILISDDEEEKDPIAAITSDQESVFLASESLPDILRKVEEVVQQMLAAISSGRGRNCDLPSFITDSVEDIQRVGGARLARWCEVRLTCLEELIYLFERLIDSDPHDEITPLVIDARTQREREHKARTRRISEQETIVANLYERQRRLQRKIDAYNNAADSSGIRTVQGEKTLKDFELESARVQNVYRGELEVLRALRREDATASAAANLAYTKLQKEEEERVLVEHVEKLADIEAKIASFSLSDLI